MGVLGAGDHPGERAGLGGMLPGDDIDVQHGEEELLQCPHHRLNRRVDADVLPGSMKEASQPPSSQLRGHLSRWRAANHPN